jgi:CelD/BcsL family acetyltransferase involved in cellulose biosynthesis
LGRSRIVALNPTERADWDASLNRIAGSSFFHSSAWCRVLCDTYSHQPVYFSRLAAGKLEELLPMMEISSVLTGRRGVSLPFSDVCPRLATTPCDGAQLFEEARQEGVRRGWKYLEFRNSCPPWAGAFPSLTFWSHTVELDGGAEACFKNLEGALRRGIRKAEAAGLKVEISDSIEAIRLFFKLHCRTRRRHGVPPQPREFFENIARWVFQARRGFVVTARLEQRPVAAAVFFHWGKEAIYKFGASDYRFQHLRPNNLVMWEAIRKYAQDGFSRLDLGRTSLVNQGLRRFKAGFGAREEKIAYYRYELQRERFVVATDRAEGPINQIFRCLPSPLFRLAGRILYPHLS